MTRRRGADRGRRRRVITVDTRADARDADAAARLSGDRARIPVTGDWSNFPTGAHRLARLPTADEQARGEWPDRDEVEDG